MANPSSNSPVKGAAAPSRVSAPITDLAALPAPVTAIRRKILQACAKGLETGEAEALRVPIDWNEVRPLFSRGVKAQKGFDPVALVRRLSFDGGGLEYLTLLRNVLRLSCVRIEHGGRVEYGWPAFAWSPPQAPGPAERQAMAACVRFSDLATMAPMRAGFGADGVWHYFWSEPV